MEYEAIINPVPHWRISLSLAKNEAVKSNVAAEELAFGAAWRRNLETMFGGRLLNGSRQPGIQTQDFWSQYNTETLTPIRTAAALSGTATPEVRKWRANIVTNYSFQGERLKGVHIGGALRWQDKIGIGYPLVRTASGESVADITKPYWGPQDTAVDLSIGYRRKLKFVGRNVAWAINLNVRNLNAKEQIIPIQANADGSYGNFRIPPERTWSLTNSFTF